MHRGGHLLYPLKGFVKFGHQNAGPPYSRFFQQPPIPPQKNLKMTVHLWKTKTLLNSLRLVTLWSTPQLVRIQFETGSCIIILLPIPSFYKVQLISFYGAIFVLRKYF